MTLAQLNTKQLHGAIISGCQNLTKQRAILNRINIFPVADGDTGDNMAATAAAIINFSTVKSSIDETLQSIADAGVIGARGNSGIIFSQFFNALNENPVTKEQINIKDFAELLRKAAICVRAAIASPIDGTMLTIIETWAKIFGQSITQSIFFNEIMQKLLPVIKATVNQTTNLLSVLKQANVVDAGALGFYYFVQGFTDFLKNPTYVITAPNPLPAKPSIEHDLTFTNNEKDYRYCTEALLKGCLISRAEITKILENHGNSVVLTSNDRVCRFHVHTNNPSEVFSNLLNIGTIQYPKVDDMFRQFEVIHQRQNNIALVTDSSADLPRSLQDRYQIHQLPQNIHLGDHQLLNGFCMVDKQFYENISQFKNYPTTSCSAPEIIAEKLDYLAKHYEHVLVLSVSNAMSGTFSAIMKAAASYQNVKVIDSKTASGAHGLLLTYAGDLINVQHNVSTVVEKIQDAINQTTIFVTLNQFESVIRSGRIYKFAGQIAQLSGLKLIFSINHHGKAYICAKTFNSSLAKLITIVQKKLYSAQMKLAQYCIVHANALEKANEFASMTTQIFKKPPDYIESITLAIGLHAGQGCIGLAVRMTKE